MIKSTLSENINCGDDDWKYELAKQFFFVSKMIECIFIEDGPNLIE
jgi:hypothetical protein